MARYHINPATGNPGMCSASEGNCPFKGHGDEESTHYPSASAAREGYEEAQRSPLAKVEKHIEVNNVDESQTEVAPAVLSGTFSVNRSFPEAAWVAHQSRWEKQGLTSVSQSLNKLRKLEPGTAEYAETFSEFSDAFSVEADKLRDAYAVTTRELINTKAAFQDSKYERDTEAKTKAAYAYLDSYAAADQVNQVVESFAQMKDQLTAQLALGPLSAQASYSEFEAEDKRRWEGLPVLPGWERDALEATELSSVKLLRYQHLGGGFVKRYEEALAFEEANAKPQGLFSRFRRTSITSIR